MANITIDVDTDKGTLKVSLDGKNIPDVKDVRAYTFMDMMEDGEQEARVDIISGTTDEESGVCRTLMTCCSKDKVEAKDQLTTDLINVLFSR